MIIYNYYINFCIFIFILFISNNFLLFLIEGIFVLLYTIFLLYHNSPPRPQLVCSTGVVLSLPSSARTRSLRCVIDSRITCCASLNSSVRLPT